MRRATVARRAPHGILRRRMVVAFFWTHLPLSDHGPLELAQPRWWLGPLHGKGDLLVLSHVCCLGKVLQLTPPLLLSPHGKGEPLVLSQIFHLGKVVQLTSPTPLSPHGKGEHLVLSQYFHLGKVVSFTSPTPLSPHGKG